MNVPGLLFLVPLGVDSGEDFNEEVFSSFLDIRPSPLLICL